MTDPNQCSEFDLEEQSLSADDIFVRLQAYTDRVAALRKALPVQCGNEGHVWDHPEGVEDHIPMYRDADGDIDSSPFRPRARVLDSIETVYRRKCIRCGFSEQRSPRLGNPFTE